MEERVEDDISEISQDTTESNGNSIVINNKKIHPPFSVVWTTVLFCAEFVCASVLSSMYHTKNRAIWTGLTVTFIIVPSVLTQLTLTFVHRDLRRDRPLVLFMHILQMGPIIRCIEALAVYFKADSKDDPYSTIIRKIRLKNGNAVGSPMEWKVGHSEQKLAVHRDALKRTAVIQAFLGSAPQLILQLYAVLEEKYILPARLTLMIISLVSVVYGALVCNMLAIQISYDEYKVSMKFGAYLCMVLWRALEIGTRVISLVLFSTALNIWVIPVGLASLLFYFFYPWVQYWIQQASRPENIEKNLSMVGTYVVLCLVTLLYACVSVFCWSAVQVNLAKQELIEKQPHWRHLAIYYTLRFTENVALIAGWYVFKSEFYEYVCAPLLAVQLIVCYFLAVIFMLLFYQFYHPARKLFTHNVEDCLHCACC